MATDKRTIESYNGYAEKWAEMMRSGQNTAHTYLEKPAMYKKLPELTGKSVLCIGCGTGEECEHIKSLGAERLVGIDISGNLVEYAKQSYPDLEFREMDMEKLDFPADTFDLVYSSLTMHYVKDWTKTLKRIHKVLKRTGVFLLSTHHPVRWGAETSRSTEKRTHLMGYERSGTGGNRVFGDYLNTRKIDDIWFDEFPVSYYHRPLSDIIRDILDSGFIISDFVEPKPLGTVEAEAPDFYEINNKIPLFMIFELTKK